MRHTHLTLVPAAKVTRVITAVRRALLWSRPADAERVWEPEELGAVLLDEAAPPQDALGIDLTRRARSRLIRSHGAPPSWRLPRRRFEALLASSSPFDALPPEQIAELGAIAEWVAVPPGGKLFSEGDSLGHAYVVAQGRFDIAGRHGATLGNAGPGSALGLCAALGAERATATVTARLGGSALRLPTALVADAALCEAAFRDELLRLGDLRRLCHLLASSVFADLCGPVGRAGTAALFRRRLLSAGEPLVQEGEVQNGFALVETGHLALWMRAGAGRGELPVAVAGPGQALGTLCSLRSKPCLGSLRATERTEIQLLDHEAFRTLLDWNPSLAGLPALLASRSQLVAGSFFAAQSTLPFAAPAWLEPEAPAAVSAA